MLVSCVLTLQCAELRRKILPPVGFTANGVQLEAGTVYAPIIHSARTRARYRLSGHRVVFLDNIKSTNIEYEFAIGVFDEGSEEPVLFVTSERNNPRGAADAMRASGLNPDDFGMGGEPEPVKPGETHFLCTFDNEGHANRGVSDRWADPDVFEAAAMEIIHKRFGEMPTRVPDAPNPPGTHVSQGAARPAPPSSPPTASPRPMRPRKRPMIQTGDTEETEDVKMRMLGRLGALAFVLLAMAILYVVWWFRG